MAVPEKLPDEVAALLKRMVSIAPAERPTLREVYTELLRLHATFSSTGCSAKYLRTVWGIPSRVVPSNSSHVAEKSPTLSHGLSKEPVENVAASAKASHAASDVAPSDRQSHVRLPLDALNRKLPSFLECNTLSYAQTHCNYYTELLDLACRGTATLWQRKSISVSRTRLQSLAVACQLGHRGAT